MTAEQINNSVYILSLEISPILQDSMRQNPEALQVADGYKVSKLDEFEYKDPVDLSVSSHQVC